MTEFRYNSAAQEVLFGAGILTRLGEAVDRHCWRRLMLCTIPRFQSSGLVSRLTAISGPRLVAIYAQVRPHVLQKQVEAVTTLASENKIDAVIGMGGGSPIGMAKAVSLALEERETGHPARAETPTDQPLIPVIAIPTTYSGSEMTPIYGITQETGGISCKVTVTNPKVTPKLVIYDPELTLPLPPQMTASSGINALAHCIEAVYSITRNPLSTIAALQGVRHITRSLLQAVEHGDDLGARTALFLGAYLGAVSVSTAKIGLHHGLCHVLGGTAGVPHGIANAIILPHSMGFNADTATSELADVARAMGLAGEQDQELVEQSIQTVYNLITQIGLPQRLRDVGVAEADLPRLAKAALKSAAVRNNPKPITNAAQIESVYRAAW